MTVENDAPSEQEAYICIAPEEGRLVYKYFNSVLSKEDACRFYAHLLLCFRCQEVIFSLDQIYEAAQQYRDEVFRPSEMAAKNGK